jgi:hypothetical protein
MYRIAIADRPVIVPHSFWDVPATSELYLPEEW